MHYIRIRVYEWLDMRNLNRDPTYPKVFYRPPSTAFNALPFLEEKSANCGKPHPLGRKADQLLKCLLNFVPRLVDVSPSLVTAPRFFVLIFR